MATRVTPVILGIDVSKEWLDVCQHGDGAVIRIANERRAIKQLLRAYPPLRSRWKPPTPITSW